MQVVASGEEIERLHGIVRDVPAAANIVDYATRLVRATRPAGPSEDGAPEFVRRWVKWGCGPACRAGAPVGREGAGAPRRPERRRAGRCSCCRAGGAAPQSAAELPGRSGWPRPGPDHQPAARCGAPVIDPSVLTRIADLELIARVVVEGAVAGLHRSPFHGYSAEFSQHRPYRPGDDLKHVDWKLFARTDRVYTNNFSRRRTSLHTL